MPYSKISVKSWFVVKHVLEASVVICVVWLLSHCRFITIRVSVLNSVYLWLPWNNEFQCSSNCYLSIECKQSRSKPRLQISTKVFLNLQKLVHMIINDSTLVSFSIPIVRKFLSSGSFHCIFFRKVWKYIFMKKCLNKLPKRYNTRQSRSIEGFTN